METDNKTPRKNRPPFKVYGPPEERLKIVTNAKALGLSLSNYLLKVGAGYQPLTKIDREQVDRLAHINGDLGRLGGLLKLWLTDDSRAAEVGASSLRAALGCIEATQAKMKEIIKQLILPKQ